MIRSYGTPNGAGSCSVAQCYDKTWATLAQSKVGWYCQLVGTTHNTITHSETKLHGTINNNILAQLYLELSQFGAS